MGVLLGVVASLMLSYGGAFGANALLDRHVSSKDQEAEQLAVGGAEECTPLSELNEGIFPS